MFSSRWYWWQTAFYWHLYHQNWVIQSRHYNMLMTRHALIVRADDKSIISFKIILCLFTEALGLMINFTISTYCSDNLCNEDTVLETCFYLMMNLFFRLFHMIMTIYITILINRYKYGYGIKLMWILMFVYSIRSFVVWP